MDGAAPPASTTVWLLERLALSIVLCIATLWLRSCWRTLRQNQRLALADGGAREALPHERRALLLSTVHL